MEHHGKHNPDPSGRLLLSILLNGLITIVEIAGGLFSNSLALISDAIHNLSDTLALMLAWTAHRVGGRKPDVRKTFGYKRFEIISAFVNASILTAISLYLVYAALGRMVHPDPVRSGIMFWIAMTGLIVNLTSMLFLRMHSGKSLNIRAAYLHLLGDTFSSLAVIAGAVMIYLTNASWIDPLLTIVISVVIIIQAYQVLRQSIDILMQSTPRDIDLREIKHHLEKHPLIRNIHHVHCWQLQDQDIIFEAHIETSEDMRLSESRKLSAEIEEMLKNDFSITHTTLQIEFEVCEDLGMIRHPEKQGNDRHNHSH